MAPVARRGGAEIDRRALTERRASVSEHPPRLLTIAGSDSGGGAGIQADLKTFAAHGAYGMSAITAVTAQDTQGVYAVHEIPPPVVAAQIDAVFGDLGVDAVKIGMLASAALIDAVAGRLAHWRRERPVPVVLDPVMVAKSGDPLLADDSVAALRDRLLPLATVITPNVPEAQRLTGQAGEDEASREQAGRRLSPSGTPAVLLKGGHAPGPEVVDLLWAGGDSLHRFANPRLSTRSDHGTGCTLSSALAANLALGLALPEAVERSISYLRSALVAAYPLGSGRGPVNHLVRWRDDAAR